MNNSESAETLVKMSIDGIKVAAQLSGEGIKNSSYIDKRTNKEYSRSSLRTYTNQIFTDYYNKWYIFLQPLSENL